MEKCCENIGLLKSVRCALRRIRIYLVDKLLEGSSVMTIVDDLQAEIDRATAAQERTDTRLDDVRVDLTRIVALIQDLKDQIEQGGGDTVPVSALEPLLTLAREFADKAEAVASETEETATQATEVK